MQSYESYLPLCAFVLSFVFARAFTGSNAFGLLPNGSGLDKWISTVIYGFAGWLYSGDIAIGMALAAGYLVAKLYPHELAAVSGDPIKREKSETFYKICWKLIKAPDAHKARGTLWMCLRGVFWYPTFIAIGMVTGSAWPLLFGLTVFIDGLLYYAGGKLAGNPKGWRVGEVLCGASRALAVVGCL